MPSLASTFKTGVSPLIANRDFAGLKAKLAPWLPVDVAPILRELLDQPHTAIALTKMVKKRASWLGISSGGNAGSQAATLVIRALALGEFRLRDWWRIMRRELAVGIVL